MEPPTLRPVELRGLLAIAVDVQPLVDLGGGRRLVPFSGGTFRGRDGLAGTVAAGGVDWQQVRADGTLEIDAHYVLTTSSGAPAGSSIEVRSTGIRRASVDVAERLGRGDAVSPDEYYFRTHIRLFTAAAELAWMNDLVAVSTGQRDRDVVHIHVHEVL